MKLLTIISLVMLGSAAALPLAARNDGALRTGRAGYANLGM